MIGERLGLRLFLDAHEVPVVGAQCTFSDGAPAQAQIQVIPTNEVYDLPARTLVTLYYYDNYAYDSVRQSFMPRGADDLRRWKTLFVGELVGIRYNKRSGSRGAVLTCTDLTGYWDAIQQHGSNYQGGGIEEIENAFLGVEMGSSKSSTATGNDLQSNMIKWLQEKVGGKVSIIKGAHRLLREIFFTGNYFYREAFNRLRLGDCVVGLPDDTTSQKLFSYTYFKKYLESKIASGGDLLSARSMLDRVLAPVMYNYVTVPGPMLDSRGEAICWKPEAGSELSKLIMSDRSCWGSASLNSTIIKPDSWFLPPPTCNVVFPHMYDSIDFQRSFTMEPSRLLLRTEVMVNQGRKAKRTRDRLYAPDFEALKPIMEKTGGYRSRMSSVLMAHEFFAGPNTVFAFESDMGKYASDTARRKYLSKFTDYLYWKYRLGARQGRVHLAFTPDMVAGFPAVVIDQITPNSLNKHIIGHVRTLTHSVNQRGGRTTIDLVGVRQHDENFDFDKPGIYGTADAEGAKSFEEVVLRQKIADGTMTDADPVGFFDDRYLPENIGSEVYMKLLGCSSIIDHYDASERAGVGSVGSVGAHKTLKELTNKDAVRTQMDAVASLANLYTHVSIYGKDLTKFTKGITGRNQSDLVHLLGIPDGHPQEGVLTSDGYSNCGFFCTAVDPSCSDSAAGKTSFESTRYKTTKVTVPGTPVGYTEAVVGQRDDKGEQIYREVLEPPIPPEDVTKSVTTSIQEKGTWAIAKTVETREGWIKRYVVSLLFRGQRG